MFRYIRRCFIWWTLQLTEVHHKLINLRSLDQRCSISGTSKRRCLLTRGWFLPDNVYPSYIFTWLQQKANQRLHSHSFASIVKAVLDFVRSRAISFDPSEGVFSLLNHLKCSGRETKLNRMSSIMSRKCSRFPPHWQTNRDWSGNEKNTSA